MPAPPPWVLAAVADMTADGLQPRYIVSQLQARGYVVSTRQLKRWKEKKMVPRRRWTGSDAALDAWLRNLLAAGEITDNEGFRWVHGYLNNKLAPLRIGKDRVQRALLRVAPAAVDARKQIVKKRLLRRVYTAPYYGFADHIDYNCKLTFGPVHLYIYGQVDGDSRYIKVLNVVVVKTARTAFLRCYVPSLAANNGESADVTSVDAGGEWAVICWALEQQGAKVLRVKSVNNTKVERPWLDVNVKCNYDNEDNINTDGSTRTAAITKSKPRDKQCTVPRLTRACNDMLTSEKTPAHDKTSATLWVAKAATKASSGSCCSR